jgi:hypothetical protein
LNHASSKGLYGNGWRFDPKLLFEVGGAAWRAVRTACVRHAPWCAAAHPRSTLLKQGFGGLDQQARPVKLPTAVSLSHRNTSESEVR